MIHANMSQGQQLHASVRVGGSVQGCASADAPGVPSRDINTCSQFCVLHSEAGSKVGVVGVMQPPCVLLHHCQAGLDICGGHPPQSCYQLMQLVFTQLYRHEPAVTHL